MELFAKDVYQVENELSLNANQLQALFNLYQPLVGSAAVALYMTLVNSRKFLVEQKHQYLCNTMDLSIEALERARTKLEQYGLCKSFVLQKEPVRYLYHLIEPLEAPVFLEHYLFGISYKKVMGLHEFEYMKSLYAESIVSSTGYVEITERLKATDLPTVTSKDMSEFVKLKNDSKEIVLPDSFDYSMFLKGMSNLTFPKKLRTDENLLLIGQLATVYGISETRMRVLVSRSIDIDQGVFQSNRLTQLVRREKGNQSEIKVSGYQLPPVLFLQEKQFGAPVTNTDKKLLEELVNDVQLAPEVVNVLIEYILDTNNKILVKDYVLKNAVTWKMHEVKTVEDAHQLIKTLSRNNKEKEMRAASVKKVDVKKKEVTNTLSEQEELELRKRIEEKMKRVGE